MCPNGVLQQPWNMSCKEGTFWPLQPPEVKHWTWKSPPRKGNSFWKPSFSGSMLYFRAATSCTNREKSMSFRVFTSIFASFSTNKNINLPWHIYAPSFFPGCQWLRDYHTTYHTTRFLHPSPLASWGGVQRVAWDHQRISRNQFLHILPETNIAIENQSFWWYLPGNFQNFYGYVSLTEDNLHLDPPSKTKSFLWSPSNYSPPTLPFFLKKQI